MGQKAESGGKLELSGSQVAGSAAATVVAAFLASSMGVYGTIIGAGVVSVVATAGGAVFQHVFRRTGEQLRDATHGMPQEAADATRVLPATGGFSEATVHGTRLRGWRRTALTAAGVFAAGMAVVVGVEAAGGGTMASWWGKDDTGAGTSIGRVLGPSGDGGPADQDDSQQPADDTDEPSTGRHPSGTPDPADTPTPSASQDGDQTTAPSPTPSNDAETPDDGQSDPAEDPGTTPEADPTQSPEAGVTPQTATD
ncbi:hypothetical protein AB0M28_10275 [Streptomyces sp. NPDC051940]|uniref:hypothetical protein n=1 Tax=Streptomyces sp. NPDC051940 TaxID=3155675 RepID=UPI0034381B7D